MLLRLCGLDADGDGYDADGDGYDDDDDDGG